MNTYPLKRLTLAQAIGQTLLAVVDIRSDEVRILRFSGGVVTLKTNYECASIMDYTDSEDMLKPPAYGISAAEKAELLAGGFVDATWSAECDRIREDATLQHELRREEAERQQYETLKAKFEPTSCTS